jgi:hypothetical protein
VGLVSADRKSPGLHRKLFLARKATEAVEKRGRNEEHGYAFARFEDVLSEASKQLEKRDILVISEMKEEVLHLGKSKAEVLAKAVLNYKVIDTKTDESMTIRWAGTGYDEPGDKALFKATTGCEKYFLRSLLNIPFGADPEEPAATEPEPGRSPEAQKVAAEQDAAAEAPDVVPPRDRPLPESDLPEPDWDGLEKPEPAHA